jgi:DNA-binding transcriptional LysR family regulator
MFERHDLGVCHYVICASPAYLGRSPRLESYLDLPQHNCLLYFDDRTNRPIDDWPFVTADGIRDVHVTGCISSNNSASLCQLTVDGFGVALLPVFAVLEEIRVGRLVAVFTRDVAFKRNLMAFHHRSEHISQNLSSFLAFIRSHLEKLSLDDLVKL